MILMSNKSQTNKKTKNKDRDVRQQLLYSVHRYDSCVQIHQQPAAVASMNVSTVEYRGFSWCGEVKPKLFRAHFFWRFTELSPSIVGSFLNESRIEVVVLERASVA